MEKRVVNLPYEGSLVECVQYSGDPVQDAGWECLSYDYDLCACKWSTPSVQQICRAMYEKTKRKFDQIKFWIALIILTFSDRCPYQFKKKKTQTHKILNKCVYTKLMTILGEKFEKKIFFFESLEKINFFDFMTSKTGRSIKCKICIKCIIFHWLCQNVPKCHFSIFPSYLTIR